MIHRDSQSKMTHWFHFNRFIPVFLLFLLSPSGKVFGQEIPKNSIEANSVATQEIQIDGLLNESPWQGGTIATEFTQQEPFVGNVARVRTTVRLVYDEHHLYIGAMLHDPQPGEIKADERQRDGAFNRSDAFAVLIDTYHDHQSAFFFETNPLSAMSDALVSQEGSQVNKDWDGLWKVKAARIQSGWSLEIKIPFKTLRFRSGNSKDWGIQFRRRVPHLKEISFWSPLSTEQTLFDVSLAGHLSGIETTSQDKPFSIKPYVKGSYERDPATTNTGSKFDEEFGLDFRYRFLTNMTLDLSYNTDFAETEVDRFQVNLTRFPLFFPEKREFFLEGKGYYDFGLTRRVQPYFSRKIGLEGGSPIPIFLGGKLSGKLGPYGLGLLLMETESRDGVPDEGIEDVPEERFGILRVSRDLGLRSNLGVIGTVREEKNGLSNKTYGFDGTLAPHPNLTADGFWIHSEDEERQVSGAAYFGNGEWRDPFWRIKLNHLFVGKSFFPELGFVQQRDLEETFGYVDIRPQPVGGIIREFGFKTEMTYQENTSGQFLYQSNYNRVQADFRSGDFILISIDPQREQLPEDFEIRPGITIPEGSYRYTHTNIYIITDTRRPVSGVFSLLWGGFYDGNKTSLDLSFTSAPVKGLGISAGWEIDWVDLPQGSFTSQIFDLDIKWSLSNTALIQWFTQYDKEDKSVAANIRFSWEYLDKSHLYFIINPTHQGEDDTLLILTKITWLWEPL